MILGEGYLTSTFGFFLPRWVAPSKAPRDGSQGAGVASYIINETPETAEIWAQGYVHMEVNAVSVVNIA